MHNNMHWKTFTRVRVWLIYQGHTNTSRLGREKHGQEAFFRLPVWLQYFYCMNVLARTGHLVRQSGVKHRSKPNSIGHDRRTDVIGIDCRFNQAGHFPTNGRNSPTWGNFTLCRRKYILPRREKMSMFASVFTVAEKSHFDNSSAFKTNQYSIYVCLYQHAKWLQ